MSTSLSNNTPKAVQAAKNKTEAATLFDGKTLKAEEDDDGITLTEVGIEEYYGTIQRDVFLKWDQLEQKKAELRKIQQEEFNGGVGVYRPYYDRLEAIIDALADYQDDLETAMSVLEFEEESHANGKR